MNNSTASREDLIRDASTAIELQYLGSRSEVVIDLDAIYSLPKIGDIFKKIAKEQNLSLQDLTSKQKMLGGFKASSDVFIPLFLIWYILGEISETEFFDNALDSKHDGFDRFSYQALWGATIQVTVSATFALFNQVSRVLRIGEKLPIYLKDRLLQNTLLSENITDGLAREIKKLPVPAKLQKRLIEKIYKTASFKNPHNSYSNTAFNSFNNSGETSNKDVSWFESIKAFIYTRGAPNFAEDFSAGAFGMFATDSSAGIAAFTSILQGLLYGVNDYANKDLEIPYNVAIQNPEKNTAIMKDFYQDIANKLFELLPKIVGRGGFRGAYEVVTKALFPSLFTNKDAASLLGKSVQEGLRAVMQQIGTASAERFCQNLHCNNTKLKYSKEEIGELLKSDKKLIESYISLLGKAFNVDDNSTIRNLKENALIALTNYKVLQDALIEDGFYIGDKKPKYRNEKLQKVLDEYLDLMRDKFTLYNSINTILSDEKTSEELSSIENIKDLMNGLAKSLKDLLSYEDMFKKQNISMDVLNLYNLAEDLRGINGADLESIKEANFIHDIRIEAYKDHVGSVQQVNESKLI